MPAHVRGYLLNTTYSLTHPTLRQPPSCLLLVAMVWLGWTNTKHDCTLDQILRYYWTWQCAFCCNFITAGFVRNLECRYYRASDLLFYEVPISSVWWARTGLPRDVFIEIILRVCWIGPLCSHGISHFTRLFTPNPLLSYKQASISRITIACGAFSGDYFYSHLLRIASDYVSAHRFCPPRLLIQKCWIENRQRYQLVSL